MRKCKGLGKRKQRIGVQQEATARHPHVNPRVDPRRVFCRFLGWEELVHLLVVSGARQEVKVCRLVLL